MECHFSSPDLLLMYLVKLSVSLSLYTNCNELPVGQTLSNYIQYIERGIISAAVNGTCSSSSLAIYDIYPP